MEPKTITAFRWTAEELFATSPRVYFWTSTTIETLPAWYVPRMWDKFNRELQKRIGKFKGLRVFQWHVNHGLHIHWLCNVRIPVALVRRIGKPYGFGHVDVRVADRNAPKYMTRYLAKDVLKMPNGGRAWGRIGGIPFGTRVRDIEERSERSDYIKRRLVEMRPFYADNKKRGANFGALRQAAYEYDTRLVAEYFAAQRDAEAVKRGDAVFVVENDLEAARASSGSIYQGYYGHKMLRDSGVLHRVNSFSGNNAETGCKGPMQSGI
jgi:hypothetical protein